MIAKILMSERTYIAGIDEAGRGPLAGPVTAAAVILSPGFFCKQLKDSKKLSHQQREDLFEVIKENSFAYSVVNIAQDKIDLINIRQATLLAMRQAATEVLAKVKSAYFLIDGNMALGEAYLSEAIVKGDDKLACISAASILAKVTRDRLMQEYDTTYPQYGFAKHKGYPTKDHLALIKQYGPCEIHRKTFAGVK